MTKTRQEINKDYYEKNKKFVKELVEYNRQKKRDNEKQLVKERVQQALSNGQSYITFHFQHLRLTEKEGKYVCECGGQFRKGDQGRHSKTKKHCSFVQQLFREEYEKMFNGLPNRINELIMERNHVIVKSVFDCMNV